MKKITIASLLFVSAASVMSSSALAQVATCTVTDVKTPPFSWLSSWGKPDKKYFAVNVGDSIKVEETKLDGLSGIDIQSGLLNYVEGRAGVESDPNEHRGFHFLNHAQGSSKYYDIAHNEFRGDSKGPFKVVMKQLTDKKYSLEINIFDSKEITEVHATYRMKCIK